MGCVNTIEKSMLKNLFKKKLKITCINKKNVVPLYNNKNNC